MLLMAETVQSYTDKDQNVTEINLFSENDLDLN